MSVSARLRFEVLRRDGHTCRYCGATPPVPLEVDHVLPVALGGRDEPSNLVTACDQCNSGKASTNPDAPVVAGVADDALRWAAAMTEAAALQARNQDARNSYVDGFDEEWSTWQCAGEPVERPLAWRASIERFYDLGLDPLTLVRSIETAMAHGRRGRHAEFTYLCGMCWRILDERQAIAASLLVTDGDDA